MEVGQRRGGGRAKKGLGWGKEGGEEGMGVEQRRGKEGGKKGWGKEGEEEIRGGGK